MRRAIAGALIVSYIMAFSMLMFSDYQKEQSMPSMEEIENMSQDDVNKFLQIQNQTATVNSEKMEFSNDVLSNFTNVIMVVIVFYFGSKGVLQYLKDRNPSSGDDELQDLIDKADESVKKAKSDQAEKQKAFDEAKKAWKDAADDQKETLKKEMDAAEAALNEAKKATTKKENDVKAAKKKLEDAKKKFDDAKNSLGAISSNA